MIDSSVNQQRNAPVGETGEPIKGDALSEPLEGRTRTRSRLAVTALIVVFGLGVGWIAGKFMSRSPGESPPATGVSAEIDSVPQAHAQSESRPSAKHASGEGTSSSPPQSPLVPAPPVVQSERPPQVTQVEKEEEPSVDSAANEESTKEVGPEALKKISKEIKKMHSGKPLGKNNANEDWRQ